MKKVSALFVASAMTLALLSGCSGGSPPPGFPHPFTQRL